MFYEWCSPARNPELSVAAPPPQSTAGGAVAEANSELHDHRFSLLP